MGSCESTEAISTQVDAVVPYQVPTKNIQTIHVQPKIDCEPTWTIIRSGTFRNERLFDKPDYEKVYRCSMFSESAGFTILMKWSMLVKDYPQLLNKISTLNNLSIKINQKNSVGWTAIHLASRNSTGWSSEECVQLLVALGADVNIQDTKRWTPLICAAKYSKAESSELTVHILLEAGADPNLRTSSGNTALMLSVININETSSLDTVKMLINAGANPNIRSDKNRKNALMLACNSDIISESIMGAIKLLIPITENLNLRDHKGVTALQGAAMNNQPEVCMLLLEAGANPNIQDKRGRTSLMDAVSVNSDLVQLLLDYGADITISDRHQARAANIAIICLQQRHFRNRETCQKSLKLLVKAGDPITVLNVIDNSIMEARIEMAEIEMEKKMYYIFMFKQLHYFNEHIKNKEGSCGQQITKISFQLTTGEKSKEEIYQELVDSNDRLIDYLAIRDPDDLQKKIEAYMD